VTAVDLHVHSTASDGEASPAEVVRRAEAIGLTAIALTDHDTLAGAAQLDREDHVVRVIPGCEFSVEAPWGEMHLLGYFLPVDDPDLSVFLSRQRERRDARGNEIVEQLKRLGLAISYEDVQAVSQGAALGRPHVARALVARRQVVDVNMAFERYLRDGRPAFVPKVLSPVAEVIALVRQVGGVTAAAHLKERATADTLRSLAEQGMDAVEVIHPSHDARTQRRITGAATAAGLLPTGGSDWHGDRQSQGDRGALGSMAVPAAWLSALEDLHTRRARSRAAA